MISAFSAVLLAAGRSSRMGRDKALLEIDGRPLWERQRDILVNAGAVEVLLSARTEQAWSETALRNGGFRERVQDAQRGAGPLAGIVAALARVTQSHLAALAIDLPAMTAAWFRELAALADPGVGVVARHDGFFEPLAAFYPRELRPMAEAALANGELSLQRLLHDAERAGLMRVREIGPAELALFANWNEPSEK